MEVLTGACLVVLTWVVIALVLVTLGMLAATLTSGQAGRLVLIRRALWWGLLIATIEICALSLAVPLRSVFAAVVVICSVVILGVPGWIRWSRATSTLVEMSTATWIMVITLALSQIYLAVAALGPVTGYDSGLYHLGAIRYAGEFSALPGLANLYGPLAYSTAEFPLGAFLGNGPWGVEGFRLLNGLILGIVAVDLVLRALARKSSPGLYVLLVGVVAAWIPMVALSDFWVTSPSQDSAVLALTIVCAAYLADACFGRNVVANGAVALTAGISLVMIRSTMAVFVLAVLTVLAVVIFRHRRDYWSRSAVFTGLFLLTLALIAATVLALRDYLLSGWLQYPLSIHAFNVPWRAADPEGLRLATLGFARDPANIWDSVTGWGWVGPWIARLPQEWAFAEFCALALVAIVTCVLAFRGRVSAPRWRVIFLAMFPSALAIAVWWTTSPPAFRFAWGPLFTLAAIPIGATLWFFTRDRHAESGREQLILVCAAIPVLAVTLYSAVARLDTASIAQDRDWNLAGLTIPYAVTPVVDAPVTTITLGSGLIVMSPTQSDQCWDNYPLCTPQVDTSLRLRTDSLGGGFLP